jgi:hypothetical protein
VVLLGAWLVPSVFAGPTERVTPGDDAAVVRSTSPVPSFEVAMPPPTHLRCENLLESVAQISEPRPRFSYLHGEFQGSFGLVQASYRITVTNFDIGSGNADPLWDSGAVNSSRSSQIVYNGTELAPFTRYRWTIEWTSSSGHTSAQAHATFETGPLNASDWQGAGWLVGRPTRPTKHGQPWPTGRMQLRSEFSLPPNGAIAFARAYVAATGCAQVEVNGRVPEVRGIRRRLVLIILHVKKHSQCCYMYRGPLTELLARLPVTQPDLRGVCPWPASKLSTVRYLTHDITTMLAAGKRNAIGLILGEVNHGKLAAKLASQVLTLVVVKFTGIESPWFFSSGGNGWEAAESYVDGGAWSTAIDWTRRQPGELPRQYGHMHDN